MATLIFISLAISVLGARCQCLPRPPLLPQQEPVAATPVVTSTVIDNSVSIALANALQLLIVSNLIENTMKLNCAKERTNVCETIPILSCVKDAPIVCDPVPLSMYPTVDIIPPEVINPVPCNNFLPMPCETYLPPCETYLPPCEIIPCETYQPPYEMNECIPDTSYVDVTPNYYCECQSYTPNNDCSNFYQNVGYDVINPIVGQISQAPIIAEVVIPSAIPAQLNCNLGYSPNMPFSMVPCVNCNLDWPNTFDSNCNAPYLNPYGC